MILLDTNVVSAIMRIDQEPAVQKWLAAQDITKLHVPIMVVFEIQFGIACAPVGRRRRQVEAQRIRVFDTFIADRVIPFDAIAALEAAEVYAMPANRHRDEKIIDFQIAGIARAHRAPLATRNTKDFAGLGVKIVNPWDKP
jgi:toxin FitB